MPFAVRDRLDEDLGDKVVTVSFTKNARDVNPSHFWFNLSTEEGYFYPRIINSS
jgi:hypothetical protein